MDLPLNIVGNPRITAEYAGVKMGAPHVVTERILQAAIAIDTKEFMHDAIRRGNIGKRYNDWLSHRRLVRGRTAFLKSLACRNI
jgi:hypothetical protein